MAYGHKTPHQARQRATSVLWAARGHPNARIAVGTRLHVDTVRTWPGRFAAGRLPALADRKRSGRPVSFTALQVAEVKAPARQLFAETGAPLSRWSCPEPAREVVARSIAGSISHSTGRQVPNLRPHRPAQEGCLCQCQARAIPRTWQRPDLTTAATTGQQLFLADHIRRVHLVTRGHLTEWLARCATPHNEAVALRSMFKILKSQRLLSTNPARGVSLGARPCTVPQPLGREAIKSMAEAAATDPALKLLIALIGIHAPYPHQARALPVFAIDFIRGRHALGDIDHPLDTFTRQAAADCIELRRERWPDTRDPHLFISSQTAYSRAAVTIGWMQVVLRGLPLTAQRLCENRILGSTRRSWTCSRAICRQRTGGRALPGGARGGALRGAATRAVVRGDWQDCGHERHSCHSATADRCCRGLSSTGPVGPHGDPPAPPPWGADVARQLDRRAAAVAR
ncbi:helix-turn-helix domain-containing protein [Streptomyces sp. HUAS MG47]|uniref:helix-turn-helix domain-containing protein n=1 Tax=Streptomyces solicamelliae TaxID=3231716 RepID=UPI003877D2DA